MGPDDHAGVHQRLDEAPRLPRPALAYEATEPHSPHDPWPKLIRTVAYFGFAVGAARVFNAWGYLPFGMPLPTPAEYGAFARELFPTIVQGLLMLLVGLGIIGAAVAGLLRKEWAPTVLMLNEHMAIVLYAVAALMGLARIYLADRPESYSWSLAAWVASELAINLGYPVLAAAIFRTRAVRAWFRTPVEAADE